MISAESTVGSQYPQPEVLLHIGTHKTGSTAIQSTFQSAHGQLKEAGLFYLPKFKKIYALQMAQSLNEALVEQCQGEFHDAIAKASKEIDTPLRYLMSSELFCGDPAFGYTNAPFVVAHLKRIFADAHVTVIVYLRRQDDYLQSIYTQLIHQGSTLKIESYLHSLPPGSFDWFELLETYGTAFGRENLIVRTYDAARLQACGGLINDFALLCGLDPTQLDLRFKATTKNNGYTPRALEVARVCNPLLTITERKKLRRQLQTFLSKAPFEPYSLLTADQRFEIWQRYSGSNQRVFEQFIPRNAPTWPSPVTDSRNHSYKGPQSLSQTELLDTLLGLIVEREPHALGPPSKQLLAFCGPPHDGFALLSECLTALGLTDANGEGTATQINARLLQNLGVDSPAVKLLSAGWQNSVAVFVDAAPAIELMCNRLRHNAEETFFLCEPDLALTLPLWQEILHLFSIDTTWIFFHRNPHSVTRTVWQQDQSASTVHDQLKTTVWCTYYDALALNIEEIRCSIDLLSYDLFASEPVMALNHILSKNGISFNYKVTEKIEAITEPLCCSTALGIAAELTAKDVINDEVLFRYRHLLQRNSLATPHRTRL